VDFSAPNTALEPTAFGARIAGILGGSGRAKRQLSARPLGDFRCFVLDRWYNDGYTIGMKTAISLPDPLFAAAEQFAQERGLSRSELYAKALQFYLQAYQTQTIIESLNQVYASTSSTLDSPLAAAQLQALPKEDW
jgi:hypothetical protein